MQSKNIVFTAPMQVEVLTQPVPALRPNELLCKANMSLISIGTESRCLRGDMDEGSNWSEWVQYPFNAGYSMAATVLEAGREVGGYKPGDRIFSFQAHSQYFTVDPEEGWGIVKVPDALTDVQAIWGAVMGTVAQLAVRRADHRLGDTAAVIGLGPIGLGVVQWLKIAGLGSIIAIDLNEKRLTLAKRCGATHTICKNAADAYEDIRELTGGELADIVWDVTGLPQVISAAARLVRPMGKIMLTGDNTRPSQQAIGPYFFGNALSLITTNCELGIDAAKWDMKKMAAFFFRAVAEGRMDPTPLSTDFFSPEDAPKVYDWLLNDRPDTVGVLFDWSRVGT